MNPQEVFKEFDSIQNKITISISKVKAELSEYKDAIVLYGAGSAGIAFLYYLRDIGIYPACFADGDPEKWGSTREGLEIIPYTDIKKRFTNPLVIVTINTDGRNYCKSFKEALRAGGHAGVHQRLREAGCEHTIDYTWFRRCHDLFQGDRYNLPSCSDVLLMSINREKIEDTFATLEDDASREIFLKILCFRLIDDSLTIPTLTQEHQYFEPELYHPAKPEYFVDCGAFNGISLNGLLRHVNNSDEVGGYYGIEPDPANFEVLKDEIKKVNLPLRERMEIFPCALGAEDGYTHLYALSGPGSFLAPIGMQEVCLKTLDGLLAEKPATMIKMNIEGAELDALRGAGKIIKTQRPLLAIAGYNKTHDLWEIPLLIKRYYKDYRLYLRSYMNHISFVYYAIPDKC
jgi:FkbM family methyltransferase